MEEYHYVFRWYTKGTPPVIEVEKHIYAPSFEAAQRVVAKEWPLLDLKSAMVERIKGNGEGVQVPPDGQG